MTLRERSPGNIRRNVDGETAIDQSGGIEESREEKKPDREVLLSGGRDVTLGGTPSTQLTGGN